MEQDRSRYGRLSGIIGMFCNIILATSKCIIGLMTGMVSIVADAVNNFSDAASSIISLIGFKLASKPADEEHPFGHARYEYISGLVVAFLVMIAGVELLMSSVPKVLNPEEATYNTAMYVVLGFSIFVKLMMAIVNYRIGRKICSPLVLATAADSRNDVISTSAVLIAAIVSRFLNYNLDGVMGVLVALFVLWSGIGLIKDTSTPLLGTAPDAEFVDCIEKRIMSYDKVLSTHDLMVHDYGPGRRFASAHVEMPAEADVIECHEIIDKIEQDCEQELGLHMVLHYDPIVTSDEAVGSLRSYLKKQAVEIHPDLTIHDLRIVPGEKNTNVIFDCVVPHSCDVSEVLIKREFDRRLRLEYPDHTAVVKIDKSFVSRV